MEDMLAIADRRNRVETRARREAMLPRLRRLPAEALESAKMKKREPTLAGVASRGPAREALRELLGRGTANGGLLTAISAHELLEPACETERGAELRMIDERRRGIASSEQLLREVRGLARQAPVRQRGSLHVRRQHALRNALIPFITSVGIMTGYLLGGAIVVEQVFAIPGLGRLILGAIAERNYPLLQATILMVTLGFVVVNFVVDLLYLAIDPRVRA